MKLSVCRCYEMANNEQSQQGIRDTNKGLPMAAHYNQADHSIIDFSLPQQRQTDTYICGFNHELGYLSKYAFLHIDTYICGFNRDLGFLTCTLLAHNCTLLWKLDQVSTTTTFE